MDEPYYIRLLNVQNPDEYKSELQQERSDQASPELNGDLPRPAEGLWQRNVLTCEDLNEW